MDRAGCDARGSCLLLALVAAAERENGDGNGYNFNAFFSDDVLLPPLEVGSRVQFWVAAGNAVRLVPHHLSLKLIINYFQS